MSERAGVNNALIALLVFSTVAPLILVQILAALTRFLHCGLGRGVPLQPAQLEPLPTLAGRCPLQAAERRAAEKQAAAAAASQQAAAQPAASGGGVHQLVQAAQRKWQQLWQKEEVVSWPAACF